VGPARIRRASRPGHRADRRRAPAARRRGHPGRQRPRHQGPEDVVAIDGTGLLDSTLGVLTAAWGRSAAPLDGVHIHGLALVLHHYDLQAELDPDRLIAAMQDIAPRQVKARAGQLREVRKGIMPRLVAAVMVDRYNAQPGRKAESFFLRLPPKGAPTCAGPPDRRRDDVIRTWARQRGLLPRTRHGSPS